MLGVRRGKLPLAVMATVIAATVGGAPGATASSGSVRVPHLVGTFVARGYARLHRVGVRVTIPRRFVIDSLAGGGEILGTSPSAGQRVAIGSTVSLTVGCNVCALGSPAVPKHLSAYTVPNFVDEPLSAVLGWINPKTLYLTEHFAPIHAATAARLADSYRVARQHPAPGATLRLGIGHKTSPNSGSFLPTPLTVWLVQTAPRADAVGLTS